METGGERENSETKAYDLSWKFLIKIVPQVVDVQVHMFANGYFAIYSSESSRQMLWGKF